MDDRDAIFEVLGKIRAAWTSGRTGDLAACFDERMIIVPPGASARVEGREACIRSYADFLGAAIITHYDAGEPEIDIWGDTAVATYPWEMAWTIQGQSSRGSGLDIFAFSHDTGRWLAVWRTIAPGSGG